MSDPKYSLGGWLTSPGWSIAYNSTGKPERVSTAADPEKQILDGLIYICQRYGRGQAGW